MCYVILVFAFPLIFTTVFLLPLKSMVKLLVIKSYNHFITVTRSKLAPTYNGITKTYMFAKEECYTKKALMDNTSKNSISLLTVYLYCITIVCGRIKGCCCYKYYNQRLRHHYKLLVKGIKATTHHITTQYRQSTALYTYSTRLNGKAEQYTSL